MFIIYLKINTAAKTEMIIQWLIFKPEISKEILRNILYIFFHFPYNYVLIS